MPKGVRLPTFFFQNTIQKSVKIKYKLHFSEYMSSKSLALMVSFCLMFCTTILPFSSAEDEWTENEPLTWGIEYDWSNLEEDVEIVSGYPLRDVIDDMTNAANYAGFNLTYVQASSGSTLFYIEQWEGTEIVTITDADGDPHYVNKRFTTFTLRQGMLYDAALLFNWDDENETIDGTLSYEMNQLTIIDAMYTEYVTADLEIVGADLWMTTDFEMSMSVGVSGQIEAGGESVAVDTRLDIEIGHEITSMDSEMRLHEPNDVYDRLQSADNGENVNPDCGWSFCGGTISTSFNTTSEYQVSVTGLPTEEIGLEVDEFDLQISDSYPDSGSDIRDFDFELSYDFRCCDTQVVEVDSGTSLNVKEAYALPMTPGMSETMAFSLYSALDGSDSNPNMAEIIGEEYEGWLDDMSDDLEGSDVFVCNNGEEIPVSWVNDGEDDCSDGSDEGVEDGVLTEFEQKLDVMLAALDDSNIEKTLSAFDEKLNNLVSDYELAAPYGGAEIFALWNDEEARFVGMMVIVRDDINGTWYNLLGPESNIYSDAPIPVSIEYLTGSDAELAEQQAHHDVTLRSLAPEENHDSSGVRDALGDDSESSEGTTDSDGEDLGNRIPTLSLFTTISLLGLVALGRERSNR